MTTDPRELPLADWHPRSQLELPATPVTAPLVPAIDIHNHLGRWLTEDHDWMIPDPGSLVATMDECGIRTVINLDGMTGAELTENVERYDRAYEGRFLTFAQLPWERLESPDGVRELTALLDDAVARGARGVKVWKTLGLHYSDGAGALLLPDDPRVAEVLAHAGALGLPVLIHTADPKAFFAPLDTQNERLDELGEMPEWWFGDRSRFPSFERLLEALDTLLGAAPETTFIGAHVGGAAEDLDLVERMLDAHPNWHVDIAGRMAELGRQPRRSAALVRAHPDRVLFGTDIYPAEAEYFRLHVRFLETLDEHFEYAPGAEVPPQGRWAVSALGLGDAPEVLRAVYAGNAERILGL